MLWLALAAVAFAAPTVDVAAGLWPLNAPAWQFVGLAAHRFPEPTLRTAIALGGGRTRWQVGVQGDVFYRSWSWHGDRFEAITAARLDLQVGARTKLGPTERQRTDLWLEWGGGWAFVPAHTDTHHLVTYTSPTLRSAVAVARGKAGVRPFALLETRTGIASYSTPGCEASSTEPCVAMWNFVAGPGIGILVGFTGG